MFNFCYLKGKKEGEGGYLNQDAPRLRSGYGMGG